MLSSKKFLKDLKQSGFKFYCGVPDSLLKDFCHCINTEIAEESHITAANEGSAIGIATGYYLSTGKSAVVYMQNSGLGNAVNPLASLASKDVYSIPILLIIGWRGEPGVSDEPQHKVQGEITEELLKILDIPYAVLPQNAPDAKKCLIKAKKHLVQHKKPYALLVKKNTFLPAEKSKATKQLNFTRETALKELIESVDKRAIYIASTGKLSRELFELREQKGEQHSNDFLTVGSMGHASQIALGIALQKPKDKIFLLDGDGAALMHLGGLATIASEAPKNLRHIIFNNRVHDSVGGQKTTAPNADFEKVAKALGYKKAKRVKSKKELAAFMCDDKKHPKPYLVECLIERGSRADLGRPTSTPIENKNQFMRYLKQSSK